MKPPKGSSQRLASLVKQAEGDVSRKIPVVLRRLYELDPEEPTSSILEEVWDNGPKQKNPLQAREDVSKVVPDAPKSNILRFECRNAYIGRRDFYNIQAIPRERLYSYPAALTKGLRFNVVKARNPANLLFNGAYYLMFQNHLQACLYYMETRDRVVNGFDLELEFVTPLEKHLSRIGSPILEELILREYLKTLSLRASFKDIFSKSEQKSRIIKELQQVEGFTDELVAEPHPNYSLLESFAGIPSRYQLVLVRNLPFGFSTLTLSTLLWDYAFFDKVNLQNSWKDIICDPLTQTHLSLIHFGDEQSAMRFVRNYHGRRWDPISKNREKQLYQPVLCEIVE